MRKLNVVILAAGKGERMRSTKPKVLHEIMGLAMIGYVINRAQELEPSKIIVVTGSGREQVEAYVQSYNVLTSVQEEQKGTAHALLTTERFLGSDDTLILYGDVPLITAETLTAFLAFYEDHRSICFMTTDVVNPHGYGRVVMKDGRILAIVEEADADAHQKQIRTINTGICIIPGNDLAMVKKITPSNRKNEYYLTEICAVAEAEGRAVHAYFHQPSSEVLGINTQSELVDAQQTMRERIITGHLSRGLALIDRNVYIGTAVKIGGDCTVYPNTYLEGNTEIGERVVIGPNVIVRDSVLGNGAVIDGFSVVEGAQVGQNVRIGPFSRIRPGTILERDEKIGNFVEVKNSTLEAGTKASHLAYIGDSEIGKDVNIGAGTITCNYDGKKKHKTVIGDNVFVGSNTSLVAPVRVGKDVVIGAGSTITKEVPEGTLAVTRAVQRHVDGYGRKKRCAE